jgi:hypothetical protein
MKKFYLLALVFYLHSCVPDAPPKPPSGNWRDGHVVLPPNSVLAKAAPVNNGPGDQCPVGGHSCSVWQPSPNFDIPAPKREMYHRTLNSFEQYYINDDVPSFLQMAEIGKHIFLI